MGEIGEDLEAERQALHAVDEDAEVEIARAGDEPQQAVEAIERAEDLEELLVACLDQ